MKYIVACLLFVVSTTECMFDIFRGDLNSTRYEEALGEGLDADYIEETLATLEDMSEYGMYIFGAGLIATQLYPIAKEDITQLAVKVVPVVKDYGVPVADFLLETGSDIVYHGLRHGIFLYANFLR